MKQLKLKNEMGFTLIEVIVVMILIGIVAVALSGIIVYAINNYIFGRDVGQLSQRAQLALARIDKELIDATVITFASQDQITYASSSGDIYILLRNGNQITLNKNGTGAQILINGLTASNGGNNFLSYFRSDGTTAWTTADGFSNLNNNANYLATIKVWITLDIPNTTNHLDFEYTINPRSNGLLNAPLLITP